MYICVCRAITEKEIREIIKQYNITKIGQFYNVIEPNNYCCKCLKDIKEIIKEENNDTL